MREQTMFASLTVESNVFLHTVSSAFLYPDSCVPIARNRRVTVANKGMNVEDNPKLQDVRRELCMPSFSRQ